MPSMAQASPSCGASRVRCSSPASNVSRSAPPGPETRVGGCPGGRLARADIVVEGGSISAGAPTWRYVRKARVGTRPTSTSAGIHGLASIVRRSLGASPAGGGGGSGADELLVRDTRPGVHRAALARCISGGLRREIGRRLAPQVLLRLVGLGLVAASARAFALDLVAPVAIDRQAVDFRFPG